MSKNTLFFLTFPSRQVSSLSMGIRSILSCKTRRTACLGYLWPRALLKRARLDECLGEGRTGKGTGQRPFAIAALASVAVFFASGGYKIQSPTPASATLFSLIDVESFIILMFWTLYVLFAALSMTWWNAKEPLLSVLKWFKGASHWCFSMGAAMGLIFAAYLLPQAFYLQIQSYDPLTRAFNYGIIIIGFGTLVGLGIYGRYRRRAAKHNQTPDVKG